MPSVGVQPLAQFLAALEERHVLGLHVHRLAGSRVAPGAGLTEKAGDGGVGDRVNPLCALNILPDSTMVPLASSELSGARLFGEVVAPS